MKSENGWRVVVDVKLRGKEFEGFRGDGLCVWRGWGWRGYKKGVGGGVIDGWVEGMEIREIGWINNGVFRRVGWALVLGKDDRCLIWGVNHDRIRMMLDDVSMKDKNVNWIEYGVGNEKVRFGRFRGFGFWKGVEDSLIWSDEEGWNLSMIYEKKKRWKVL